MTEVPFPTTYMSVDRFALWMHEKMPDQAGTRWRIVSASGAHRVALGWGIQFRDDADATLFSLLWQHEHHDN